MKCLAQRRSATPRQPRRDFSHKSYTAIATGPQCLMCRPMWSIHADTGTLRMITIRDRPQCFVLRPSQSQWDCTVIYVIMQAMRDTQSPLLQGEKQMSTGLSSNGARTWPRGVTGVHSTSYAKYCAKLLNKIIHVQYSTREQCSPPKWVYSYYLFGTSLNKLPQ